MPGSVLNSGNIAVNMQTTLSEFAFKWCLVAQSCLTLCDPMDYTPPGSSVHGNSPGKDTGAGCHALLQGIFLTQGSKAAFPMSPALANGFFTTSVTWEGPERSSQNAILLWHETSSITLHTSIRLYIAITIKQWRNCREQIN